MPPVATPWVVDRDGDWVRYRGEARAANICAMVWLSSLWGYCPEIYPTLTESGTEADGWLPGEGEETLQAAMDWADKALTELGWTLLRETSPQEAIDAWDQLLEQG